MKEENFNIENLGLAIGNIFSVFDGIEEKQIKISEIEYTMKHAKVELFQIYDMRSNFRDEVYNCLKSYANLIRDKVESSDFVFQKERLDLLDIFENIINSVFGRDSQTDVKKKLVLNIPKSVIYDLFKQLKNMTFKEGEIILTQTNEALAEFLINNVEGFEGKNKVTIEKEISRTQALKKGRLVITKKI